VAGPDRDGAPRAGQGAYPDGPGAARGGEVERVVTDQHRRSRDVEADLARHVGARCAVAVDRAELHPGGVRAVAVDLGVVGGQHEHVAVGQRLPGLVPEVAPPRGFLPGQQPELVAGVVEALGLRVVRAAHHGCQ
jgi:hypothetical protein